MKLRPIKENVVKDIRNALVEKNDIALPLECVGFHEPSAPMADDKAVLFAQRYLQLGGELRYCTDEKEILQHLQEIQATHGNCAVGCCTDNLTAFLSQVGLQDTFPAEAGGEYKMGVLLSDGLVADSAGMVLTNKQNFGTAFVSLPSVTVVMAFTSQVVGNWEELVNRMKENFKTFPTQMVCLHPDDQMAAGTRLYLLLVEDL